MDFKQIRENAVKADEQNTPMNYPDFFNFEEGKTTQILFKFSSFREDTTKNAADNPTGKIADVVATEAGINDGDAYQAGTKFSLPTHRALMRKLIATEPEEGDFIFIERPGKKTESQKGGKPYYNYLVYKPTAQEVEGALGGKKAKK